MKSIHLQIGITLDQESATTMLALITQAIEKGNSQQAAALEKLADGIKRIEHPSPPISPAAVPAPTPISEEAASPEKSGMIDVNEVAGLLNVSSRMVYRLRDSGRMPRPVKLGNLVRWSRKEIEEWMAAGCPAGVRRGARR